MAGVFAVLLVAASTAAQTNETRLARTLMAADDYLQEQNWGAALSLLQKLLDAPEDQLVPASRKAVGEPALFAGAQGGVLRRLAALRLPGRAAYEERFGPVAAEKLRAAMKSDDADALVEVARRYRHTKAGTQAVARLGWRHAHNREWFAAAGRYRQLLALRQLPDWTTDDLYQAAIASGRAGDHRALDAIRSELLKRTCAGPLVIEGDKMDRASILSDLADAKPPASLGTTLLYRVDPARSGITASGSMPLLVPRWRASLSHKGCDFGKVRDEPLVRWYRQAAEQLRTHKEPLLPDFFPITATAVGRDGGGTLVLFRSYWGTHAVEVETGTPRWYNPARWSLEELLSSQSLHKGVLDDWLEQHAEAGDLSHVFFGGATQRSLSSDDTYVYAVDDLPVPPPAKLGRDLRGIAVPPDLRDGLRQNRLVVFNLATSGKRVWESGDAGAAGDLARCFFLAPPLPLGGLLYVPLQKDSDLRLACLDPFRGGQVVWALTLGRAGTAIDESPLRRGQAAHPAYADGTLVVPTNTGLVAGIDLLDRRLAWAFVYRDAARKDDRATGWRTSAPAIVGDKVVLAPADSSEIYCLRLSDGSLVWKAPRRDDDLYFAGVFAGQALVVGKTACRALTLADGTQAWSLDTGVPSGQGTAVGDMYYLPLAQGARSREPEVCSLDVGKGTVVSRSLTLGKQVPGNLMFVGDWLISQSTTEVVAYVPVAKATLKERRQMSEYTEGRQRR